MVAVVVVDAVITMEDAVVVGNPSHKKTGRIYSFGFLNVWIGDHNGIVLMCPLFGVQITGSLKGNRTPVAGMRIRSPNH